MRRALIWVTLLALLAVAVGVSVERRALVRGALVYAMRAQGVESPVVEVERVALDGLAVGPVRGVRDGVELGIARLEVQYDMASLREGRVRHVLVEGLRLRRIAPATGSGAPESERPRSELPEVTPDMLPIERLDLVDGRIEWPLAEVVVRARVAGRLENAPTGLSASVELKVEHDRGVVSAPLEIRGDAGAWTVASPAEVVWAELPETIIPIAFRAAYDSSRRAVEGEVGIDSLDVAPFVEWGRGQLLPEATVVVDAQVHVDAEFGWDGGTPTWTARVAVADADGNVVASEGGPRVGVQVDRLEVRAHSTGPSEGRVEVDLAADLVAPDQEVRADGITLRLGSDLDVPRPSGRLEIAAVSDERASFRFPPLRLGADILPEAERVRLDGTITGLDGELRVRLSGTVDPRTGNADASLDLVPLVFREDGLQPSALMGEIPGGARNATGSIEMRATARRDGGPLEWAADVAIRDLTVMTDLAGVERINTTIHVDGPWPPSTPAGQLLALGRISSGLELTDGLVRFQLRPDGRLGLDRVRWNMADGVVKTRAVLDPNRKTNRLTLSAEGMEVARLLELVAVDGLDGTGRLEGRLPLVVRGSEIEIRGGELHSVGGGRLRYRADATATHVAKSEEKFALLLTVLDDFRYEELRVTLDGATDDEVRIGLHLRGRNPGFQDGREVVFNVDVQSRLVDILRKSQEVYRVPEAIGERYLEFREGAGSVSGGG